MKLPVSIVIPFHNEELNLKILIPDLLKEVKKLSKFSKIEILLVDDYSSDNSLRYCKKFKKKFIKLIKLKKRSGQSGALKKGFIKAKYQYILRLDSDLQDDTSYISKFIKTLIKKNSDLIIGLRIKRNHNKVLVLVSKFYDFLINIILSSNYFTLTSSYIAFNKKYLNLKKWVKNDHRYLPVIAISNGAKKVDYIKTKHVRRKFGYSKYNTLLKIIFGFPELISFLLRLKLGFYKKIKI